MGNPGLREAQKIAEFAVLGLGELAINLMRTTDESFGLITINENYLPRFLEVVRNSDAARRLTSV